MEGNGRNKIDFARWREYRNRADPDLLLPHVGKHIAWNWNATEIVASADDYAELYRKTDALGYARDEVVHDYVEGADSLL